MPSCCCAKVAAAVILPNVGGFLNSRITHPQLDTWYSALQKPWYNPPNSVFGPVWISLYSGMGYASYLVWRDGGGFAGDSRLALGLYGTQLALNFVWSPLFFHYHSFKWSLVDITALSGVAAACGVAFYKINKTAGLLFIPYVAWLAFASALNYAYYKLNHGKAIEQKDDAKEKEK